MGDVHRFQGRLLPHTHTEPVKEIVEISCPRQNIAIQSTALCLSTDPLEFTVVAKEVKLMALQKGIRINQYQDDWLVRTRSHQTCLQRTQTLVALCQDLGWLVNKNNSEKSELDPKQVFEFVGYHFDLKEGKVRPTLDW